MLRVAIVGCGYITQAEHLPNWRQLPGVEMIGVVDQRPDVAREVGEAYGIPWYPSLDELIRDQHPDVVHIATSLLSHVPLVLEAATAHAHVLVEKPFANTAEDGARALATAAAENVVLMVGCQKEADANVTFVEDRIKDGRFGRLLGVHSVFRISQQPLYRAIGDHPRMPFLPGREDDVDDLHTRMLDQSIHHFNVFDRWLPGGLTVDAVTHAGALWAIAGHSSGGVAVSHFNAAASGHGEEFWAYFEGASIHIQAWSPHFPATKGAVEVFEREGRSIYQPIVPLRNPYLAMLELFLQRITGQVPWRSSVQTAIEDLRTVEAVKAVWRSRPKVA